MAMTETFAPATWQHKCIEAKHAAIGNLIELVDGPEDGAEAQVISDPVLWVHRQFDLFRSALPDNDRRIVSLAKIEHDFIAALCALNFDDQQRQLRAALGGLAMFT